MRTLKWKLARPGDDIPRHARLSGYAAGDPYNYPETNMKATLAMSVDDFIENYDRGPTPLRRMADTIFWMIYIDDEPTENELGEIAP